MAKKSEAVIEPEVETEEEPYEVLYRRLRPHRFQDVVGQEAVTESLRKQIVNKKVPHLHLMAGPRGTGKTTTARILAQALNCEELSSDGEPCNECIPCKAVNTGQSGVGVVSLDGASNGNVDAVRDIISQVNVASPLTKNKVFIIDEAHALSAAAIQALLLTLEEPPPNVYFVLCTTELHRILPTIKSRANTLVFRLVRGSNLEDLITKAAANENYELSEPQLEAIIIESGGSPRDALSVLERVIAGGESTLEEWDLLLLNALLSGSVSETMIAIHKAVDEGGYLPRDLCRDLTNFTSNAILALHAEDMVVATERRKRDITRVAKSLKLTGLTRLAILLSDLSAKLATSNDPKFLLSTYMIRFIKPETDVESFNAILDLVEELKSEVSDLRELISSGAVSSPADTSNDEGPWEDTKSDDDWPKTEGKKKSKKSGKNKKSKNDDLSAQNDSDVESDTSEKKTRSKRAQSASDSALTPISDLADKQIDSLLDSIVEALFDVDKRLATSVDRKGDIELEDNDLYLIVGRSLSKDQESEIADVVSEVLKKKEIKADSINPVES